MSAYVRSKAIAERAAWDFMAAEGGTLELSVINPVGIFGPVLGADFSSSIDLVTRLMKGMPGCPQLYFGVVDVRDVADLHVRAMTDPAAKSERFIAVSGAVMSMLDMPPFSRRAWETRRRRCRRGSCPSWLVRFVALFDPTMRPLVPLLDNKRHATSAKAERVLGWKPRSREDAIVATAESLMKFGIVGRPTKIDPESRPRSGPLSPADNSRASRESFSKRLSEPVMGPACGAAGYVACISCRASPSRRRRQRAPSHCASPRSSPVPSSHS
jgi:hypothetical protein